MTSFVLRGGTVAPRGLSLWCIGDSITQGDTEIGGLYPTRFYGGWRAELHRLASGQGLGWGFVGHLNSYTAPTASTYPDSPLVALPQWAAYHSGVSGAETGAIISGLASYYAALNNVFGCVVVGIGTNDINHATSPDSAGNPVVIDSTKWNAIPSNVVSICQTARGYGDKPPVFVVLPPPIAQKTAAVTDRRAAIVAACAAYPWIVIVDDGLTLNDICVDGIHPVFGGYGKRGKAIFDSIGANYYRASQVLT